MSDEIVAGSAGNAAEPTNATSDFLCEPGIVTLVSPEYSDFKGVTGEQTGESSVPTGAHRRFGYDNDIWFP